MFPGVLSKQFLDEFNRYGIVEPRKFVIDLAACHGTWLVTIDGQSVMDWAGYYGSRLLSHNHPSYTDPEFQRKILFAATNKVANPDFVTMELIEYYRLLHSIAPKCITNPNLRVYTVNSGAEACENALKYCVNKWYHHNVKSSKLPRFMSFRGGFHGRTVYALHVTDMPHHSIATNGFHELICEQPVWETFPNKNLDSINASLISIEESLKVHDNLAGIIVEPMQGAGGHNVTSPEFFRKLSELAYQYEVPLIFDEVQTAGGQCGTIWMCDQFDLPHSPTCVVSAKKFGCGVVYMNEQVCDTGVLDSTWSGHIVDMVRLVLEFDVIRKNRLIEDVPRKAQCLIEGLQKLQSTYPVVSNIRGVGLYQGFSLPTRATKDTFIRHALQDESLLLLGAGTDTIRFRPNICITESDINLLLEKLERLLASLCANKLG